MPVVSPILLLASIPTLSPAAAPVSLEGETGPGREEVEAAIDFAASYLLRQQELYEPDPAVGRLADDALSAWQDEERARLEAERAENSPGQEWPSVPSQRVQPSSSVDESLAPDNS